MKNVYKLILILAVASGFAMMGCGAPTPDVIATDNANPITISWKNCGDPPYQLYRKAQLADTYAAVGSPVTGTSTTDTPPVLTKAYFYSVAGDGGSAICGTGNEDYPNYVAQDVGATDTFSNGTTLRVQYTDTFSPAFDCIFDTMKDTCNPEEEVGVNMTFSDGIGGTAYFSFQLESGDDLKAAVHFDYDGYAGACSNGVEMTGHQAAIVTASTPHDGTVKGTILFDDSPGDVGWVHYDMIVLDGEGGGGLYYLGDGAAIERYTAVGDSGDPPAPCTQCPSAAATCCNPANCPPEE